MSGGVTVDIDLYDSDIVKIQRHVLPKLNERVGQMTHGLKDWEKVESEIIDRFAEIGLKASLVSLQPYVTADGTPAWGPEIRIDGRIHPESEHDHDQHRWEVQRNILGKNQPEGTDAVPVAMPGAGSGKLWTPGGAA